MKKILIIAYNFPPVNNGGIQRIINFKKYLPRYGYETHILTTDSYGTIEGENGVFRFPDKGYDISHKSPKVIAYPFKLFREIIIRLGLVGDWYYLWKNTVLKNIEKQIDISSYSYIVASYPPESSLEIGKALSEKYGIPLIVDYRDGLMFEPFDFIRSKPFWFRNRMKNLERKLAEDAVLQITVNEDMYKYYTSEYTTKTILIRNGFDDEEELCDPDISLPLGFNILYTGSLGLSRQAYGVEIIRQVIESVDCVNFVFVGHYDEKEISELKQIKNVYIYNSLPHNQVLSLQRKADMLLLVSGEASGTSGKLYEYLFSNRPILNIGDCNNIASKMIDESDSGKNFLPNDYCGINEYISQVKNNEISFSHSNLDKYTRKNQCKELACCLDEI